MPLISTEEWEWLKHRRPSAFLVAGLMFIIDAAIVGAIIGGAANRLILLGQAFIAAGWTAGFIGLIGTYPALADRRPRLAKAGAAFVGVGIVIFVVMGVASLGYFTNSLSGNIQTLVPLFLPGVIIGSVFGFLTFGIGSLLTGIQSRNASILFIVLALFPVMNILSGVAGIQSMTATLAIVVGLALVNLAISYLLRTEATPKADMKVEPPNESVT